MSTNPIIENLQSRRLRLEHQDLSVTRYVTTSLHVVLLLRRNTTITPYPVISRVTSRVNHRHDTPPNPRRRPSTCKIRRSSDTSLRNHRRHLRDQDKREHVREQRLLVIKHDDASMIIPSGAARPLPAQLERRTQVERTWYEGILPHKDLLHGGEVVGHVYGEETGDIVEAGNVQAWSGE